MIVSLGGLSRSTALAALIAPAMLACPASAQAPGAAPVQMLPVATPDADQLAAAMRRVGDNPRDLEALLIAGELSLRLGDASGAASLFKRAEAVDPMNGRVRAGMARILVTQERPGEALRYFDQAIGFGLDPRSFAGDRGLAYDLIGEQERAQRDYRLALKQGDSDEVRRRYALSLGISGRREQALEQIEPLVRRNDRGAWRVRAFILAMTGDVPGANAIATSMMPPAMAQGLQPFFVRVATLPAADRAFAVHFGEVRPTPERIADARLVPALPVLGPDPDARVTAAIQLPAVRVPEPSARERRRLAREQAALARAEARRTRLARVTPAPRPTPAPVPVRPAPVRPAPVRPAPVLPAPVQPAPVQTAAVSPRAAPPRTDADRSVPQPGFSESIQKSTLADATRAARYRTPAARPPVQPAPAEAAPLAAAPVQSAPAEVAAIPPAPVQVASVPTAQAGQGGALPIATAQPGATVAAATAPVAPMPAPAAAGEPVRTEVVQASPAPVPASATPAGEAASVTAGAPVQVAAAPAQPAPRPVASNTPVSPRMSEDTILARIVAGIAIPGYELGVGSPPPPPPAPPPAATEAQPAPASPPVQIAQATPSPRIEPTRPVAPVTRAATPRSPERPAATDKAEGVKPEPRRSEIASTSRRRTATATEPEKAELAGKRTGKRVAETADAETRRDARTGKPAEKIAGKSAKADPKARAAKAEPKDESRIWVQVAGGAREGDLPKAWSAVQAKAPALAKRQGYATPLRATNRVVTGPFKTEAEAQALVNQLSKQGVSAFTFKSDAGQKVSRLPGK